MREFGVTATPLRNSALEWQSVGPQDVVENDIITYSVRSMLDEIFRLLSARLHSTLSRLLSEGPSIPTVEITCGGKAKQQATEKSTTYKMT